MRARTTSEFIEEAKKVHGDKYDYSKVKYVNSHTKVCITCPKHGEFLQLPYLHLLGKGCKKCAVEKTAIFQRKTTERFIEDARKVHGDKYDYSKVSITGNNKAKVTIICPKHGEFEQAPVNHITLKQGCPKCSKDMAANKRSHNTEYFIKKSREIHGDKYDYSKVEYTNLETKVTIICPEHGEFEQAASSHLNGSGCPKCSKENRFLTTKEFIEKSKKVHGNKYDYSKVNYVDTYTEVEIICPKHGPFFQKPINHLQKHGCMKCCSRVSKIENEVFCFLKENLNCLIVKNNRSILDGHEIDIYIPSKKIGIEIDGVRWHSEGLGKGKYYHIAKTLKCEEKGISLIHIFEDEYVLHKEIVLNKLKRKLGIENKLEKIYARKTKVEIVSKNIAGDFLEKNHIKGKCNSSLCIGCFYEDKLIGVMSFIKVKKNIWCLNRFSTDNNYICCGVAGKLLSFFKNNYEWAKIISLADRRWTIDCNNNLYTKLGFTPQGLTKPDYRYVVGVNRVPKSIFLKNIVSKKYTNIVTKSKLLEIIKKRRIWDCGFYKYELVNLEKEE